MSWTKLLGDKRVAAEPAARQELDDLRQMVAAELRDAHVAGVSAKGKYEFAYNAARLMATVAVRASGYRVSAKVGHHYFTFQALQAVDPSFAAVAIYFDDARDKRNDFSYDGPARISDTDAADLLAAVERFRGDAEAWVAANHPALVAV